MLRIYRVFMLVGFLLPMSLSGQCDLGAVRQRLQLPEGQNAALDYFGRVYLYDSEVISLSGGEQTASAYSNPFLGPIDAFNVAGPLQLLCQHYGSNTLCVLDKRLNAISKVDFNQTQPPLTMGLAVMTEDEHVWVHNSSSNTMHRMGLADLREDRTTADLSIIFGKPFDCAVLQPYKYGMLLADPNQGFMLLDDKGLLITKEEISAIDCIQVVNNKILLGKDDMLYIRSVNDPSGSWTEIKVETHFQAIYVTAEALVLRGADELRYYELPDCFFEN